MLRICKQLILITLGAIVVLVVLCWFYSIATNGHISTT